MIVGIFVGGRGSRLGGVAKGLLPAPGSTVTLVQRLCDEARAALPQAELVLVGASTAYSSIGLASVPDAPENIGPIGGLGGLLAHAQTRGARHALALACDLPRIGRGMLQRLASEAPGAAVVLVSDGEMKNPLIARYEVARVAPVVARVIERGQRSLQAVLDELLPHVVALELSDSERASLADWDTPADMRRDAH